MNEQITTVSFSLTPDLKRRIDAIVSDFQRAYPGVEGDSVEHRAEHLVALDGIGRRTRAEKAQAATHGGEPGFKHWSG